MEKYPHDLDPHSSLMTILPSSDASRPKIRRSQNWWRRFRSAIVFPIVVGLLIGFRGIWWPVPFQAKARNALARHENELALQWLQWASWLASENAETASLRARAYRRIGQMEQSAAALQRAHLLRAPVTRLQREQWLGQAQSGQLREVERHLSELLMDPQGDSEEICEAYVHGYLRTQRQAQAMQILESWIGDWPTHARPYQLRAKIWALKSEFVKAEVDLRRAIELEPANAEASVELASVLQLGHKYEEAIPLFERNLKVPKLASRAHVGLALCLKTQGANDRVRPLLQQAVQLASDNSQALCELGRLELESDRHADAVSTLRAAVRIAPRDDEIHYLLAQALKADGKSDEAQRHFNFVREFRAAFQELNRCEDRLAKNPLDVETLVRAGTILLDIADPEEGVVRLLNALEIDPKHAHARKLLANHYARRAETRPEFRRLAESFRDDPDAASVRDRLPQSGSGRDHAKSF